MMPTRQLLRNLDLLNEALPAGRIIEQAGSRDLDGGDLSAIDVVDALGSVDAGHTAAAHFAVDPPAFFDDETTRQTAPDRQAAAARRGAGEAGQRSCDDVGPPAIRASHLLQALAHFF